MANALPVTVRTLETCIRLSTAAAKARLSSEGVEVRDVEVAKSLMTRMLDGDAAEAAAEEVVAAAEAGNGGGRRDNDESPPKRRGGRRGGRRPSSPSSSSDSSSSSSSSEDEDGAPGAGGGGAAAPSGRRPSKARAASARRARADAATTAAAAATAAGTGRPTRGAKRLAREEETASQMDVDGGDDAALPPTASNLTEAQITAVAVAVRELLLEQVRGKERQRFFLSFLSFLSSLSFLAFLSFLSFLLLSSSPLFSLSHVPVLQTQISPTINQTKKNSAAPPRTRSTTSSPASLRLPPRPSPARPSLRPSRSSRGGTRMLQGPPRRPWLRSCSSRRRGGSTTLHKFLF